MATKFVELRRVPFQPLQHKRPWKYSLIGLMVAGLTILSLTNTHRILPYHDINVHHDQESLGPSKSPGCPAQARIGPHARPDITKKNVQELFRSDAFRNLSVDRLSGAVQIRTETFEDMGQLEKDPRYNNFYDFESYLRKKFPLIHETVQVEVVNKHNLLYTWRGSNQSLKPVLLMAHQDTVPVADDTLSQWTYPPFSGHFDGAYIYGRGSQDCKSNLVAILSAVTSLIENDFHPERTVVFAFGFDEEGWKYPYGASMIARHLVETWGKDAFVIILDEGSVGIVERFGRQFGTPEISEKGNFDLDLIVHVPGGHSSVPPHHTSIGILAEAVTALEASAAINFPMKLAPQDPLHTLLQCAAEDSSTDLPEDIRGAILDPKQISNVVDWLAEDASFGSLLHTTQAVTIFHAGNKVNSLPAFAKATVNYRVSSSESLEQVRAKLIHTLKPVIADFGLNFTVGPREAVEEGEVPEFTFALSWQEGQLEPSPVSSTQSASWKYFSGVIKHVFDEPDAGTDVLVAPMFAGGNTDTRFFWDLSRQIYRFGPLRASHDTGSGGVHDVNERIAIDAHLESILFYHEYIRVFDEAQLD